MKKCLLSVLIFIAILLAGNCVFGFTIVLDPGHGGTEPGAIAQNGELEKDLNLKIARYLKEYLEEYDVKVLMTHNGFSGYQYEIFDRAMFARNQNADLVLSLHLNSTTGASGAEVYVTENKSLDKYYNNSSSLGNKILRNLSKLGIGNRGVKTSTRSDPTDVYSDGTRADYYGIIAYSMRGCKIDFGVISPAGATPANIQNGEGVPAVLIEHCFLTGNDYKFIDSDADLKKLAEADGQAVVEQYGLKKKEVVLDSGNTPFTKDVSKYEWYYDAVEYCYNNKLMTGVANKEFGTNMNLTRGMLVTTLWRMDGAPKSTGEINFSDVSSNQYYYDAIKWATSKKIVSGYTGTTKFGPEDSITREDFAVMLRNYCMYKGKYKKSSINLNTYSDGRQVSSWAKEAMQWAVANKVVTGDSNKLTPQGKATRAQVASMIFKYKTYIK